MTKVTTECVFGPLADRIFINRFGVNDYEAYFERIDFSVRGTFEEILQEIFNYGGY